MKRVIDVSDTLYKTCKRLVSEGDPRPSESCIANSEPYGLHGEWIPVSERLPDKNMKCLVSLDFGDVSFDFYNTGWGLSTILGMLSLGNPYPSHIRKAVRNEMRKLPCKLFSKLRRR